MTQFVNPYNFIPFGSGPIRETKERVFGNDPSKLNYGWMTVRLTAKKPLIIPGKEIGNNNGHKTYDSFRFPDNKLGIPGSTLRGLIRSIYEAASDSCIPFVMNDNDITLRTPAYAAFKEQGLLCYEEGKWRLYGAEVYEIDDPIYSDKIRDDEIKWNGKLSNVIKDGFYWADIYKRYRNSKQAYECGQQVRFDAFDNHKALLNDQGENVGWLQFNVPPALGYKKVYSKKQRKMVYP